MVECCHMEKRWTAGIVSLALLATGCSPRAAAAQYEPHVFVPPATSTPTPYPTLTPDPDLSAKVYCADIEAGGSVTLAVTKALAESGEKITLESVKTLGWYIAIYHDGSIYADTAHNVLNGAPGTEHFGNVSPGDPTCVGETGPAARMHLHRSIEPETKILPNHGRIFSRINTRFSPTKASKPALMKI